DKKDWFHLATRYRASSRIQFTCQRTFGARESALKNFAAIGRQRLERAIASLNQCSGTSGCRKTLSLFSVGSAYSLIGIGDDFRDRLPVSLPLATMLHHVTSQ